MKSRPVGAEFFPADRQTDMPKLIVAFRSLRKVHKICFAYSFIFVLFIVYFTCISGQYEWLRLCGIY
jgi:hypothetical protein